MKIAVLCRDFNLGGAERIAIRLGNQWAKLGNAVFIISGSGNGEIREILRDDIKILAPGKEISRSQGWKDFTDFVEEAIAEAKPDLIFLPGNYYIPVAKLLKKHGTRTPIAMKLSNAVRRSNFPAWRNKARAFRLRRKMRFIDGLIIPHEALQQEAREVYPTNGIYVALNPALDNYPCASGTRDFQNRSEIRQVVAAGRLVPQKNFELAIDAMLRVPTHIHLVIYGDGPLRNRLEEKINASGLQNRVTLAGFLPSLESAFQQADLFLLSSDFEGLPSVMIEALAQHIPVVATDCAPTISAHFSNPALGRVVACGNAVAMAQAIIEILNQPRASATEFSKVVTRYTLQESAGSFLHIFKEIIARCDKELQSHQS